MANTSGIGNKLRRKWLLARKKRLEKAPEKARNKKRIKKKLRIAIRKRKKILRPVAVMLAFIIVGILGFLYIQNRSYHDYKILESSEQEDTVSTQYVNLDGKILRYSPDEVSVVNSNLETVWSENYQIQNPIADVTVR